MSNNVEMNSSNALNLSYNVEDSIDNEVEEISLSTVNDKKGKKVSLIARMVIIHELPLRFVEYKGFREMITHANPVVKPMSRNTLKNEILKLCHIEKCEPQYKSLPSDSEWDLMATMVEHLRSFYMLTEMFSGGVPEDEIFVGEEVISNDDDGCLT
ncbi:hypothetical protein WN943_022773 [Citrus x changshan-huyou]